MSTCVIILISCQKIQWSVAASIVLRKKETKAEYHVRDILYSLGPMTLIFSIESCDSVYRLISTIIYDLI